MVHSKCLYETSNPQIGLVIQGPLVSGGLTGATWGKGKTRAPRNHFVEFDCKNSLKSNLKEIKKHFPMTVIATWDHFETKSLEELDPSLVILKKAEPANSGKLLRKPVRGFPDLAQNNRYKQFESLNLALEYLLTLDGITHFLKIRTDQVFNWRQLKDEVNTIFQENPKKLFLPYRHEGIPFLFPDFYFGGAINELRDFLNLVGSREFSFHDNIHRDMALKYLFLNEPARHVKHYSNFFLTEDKCTEYICNEFDLLFKNNIALGTRDLFYSISWRGIKMSNNNPKFRFHGEKCDAKCTQVTNLDVDLKNFLHHNYQTNLSLRQLLINWTWRFLKLRGRGFRVKASAARVYLTGNRRSNKH